MKKKFYRVRNLKNGGIYVIDEVKLKKEPMDWELALVDNVPVINVVPVDEEEDREISYKDLKAILDEKGIEFKGNASKDELMKLLDES